MGESAASRDSLYPLCSARKSIPTRPNGHPPQRTPDPHAQLLRRGFHSQRPISRADTAPRMNAAMSQSSEARQDLIGQCQSERSRTDARPANTIEPRPQSPMTQAGPLVTAASDAVPQPSARGGDLLRPS
jgi:hypothetical protein